MPCEIGTPSLGRVGAVASAWVRAAGFAFEATAWEASSLLEIELTALPALSAAWATLGPLPGLSGCSQSWRSGHSPFARDCTLIRE